MRRLLSAFGLSGATSVATLLAGALTAKILVVTGGPALLVLHAQLRQILQLSGQVASLNGQIVTTRLLAGLGEGDPRPALAATLAVTGAGCLAVGAGLWLVAEPLARLVLAGDAAGAVTAIRLAALLLPAFTLGATALAVLTGLGRLATLARCQILGAAVGLAAALPCALLGQRHWAALVVLAAAAPVAGGAFAFLALRRMPRFAGLTRWRPRRRDIAGHVAAALPLMWVGTIWLIPPLVLRAAYIDAHGLAMAGAFEAAQLLAQSYMTVLFAGLTAHLLPALAACGGPAGRARLLSDAVTILTLAGALAVTLLLALEPWVMTLLFSAEISGPAHGPFRWMLLADYLRLIGLSYGILLIAMDDRRAWVVLDSLSVGLLTLGALAIPFDSDAGGLAYLAQQAVYVPLVVARGVWRHKTALDRRAWRTWALGALAVGAVAWMAWSARAAPDIQTLALCALVVVAMTSGLLRCWGREKAIPSLD